MSKNPPAPPDPAETAGAQTANNVSTAIANQVMGGVNQITPHGSLTYYFNGPNGELIAPGDFQANPYAQPEPAVVSQPAPTDGESVRTERGAGSDVVTQQEAVTPTYTSGGTPGTYQLTDPNTGKVYDIPQMTAVTELSPAEQRIFDAQQAARGNLADLSTDVSAQMRDHFANPFSLDGLPEGGSAGNIRAPQYSELSGNIAPAGSIHRWVNPRSDELTRSIDGLSMGVADAGEILREFGDAGEITRTYGRDYSEDRRRVEEALMSRLNPHLARDRDALHTQLINKGHREGSEAYDRAMNRADEASTDARFQAILAGGQEQTRMDDMEARRAGFENAAQQQAFMQLLGRAQFSNEGQQQQFGQNYASAKLGNEAAIAKARFENDATKSAFGMDLAAGQFANAAQAQRFGQNATMADFANRATLQNNNIQDKMFSNDSFLESRKDADRQRAIQEALLMRNQPINEIGALLGSGSVQMPSFVNTSSPQMPTVDRAGLEMQAYEQEMDAWRQQQAMWGALLGSAGRIGAGFI